MRPRWKRGEVDRSVIRRASEATSATGISANLPGGATVLARRPYHSVAIPVKLQDPVEVILKEKGREVYSITSGGTVYEALVMMEERQVGALLVMDDSELVGILSERDYARKVILAGRSSKKMMVREIMSSPVISVQLKTTVDECMQHMTDGRCRHLPVLEGDRVVGLVSLGDLVNWVMTKQDRRINDLEGYISGDYPG